ncbi:harmonin-like [Antedon mediterranea]|uniref:harmonin-like n=1 Tax=Antedon mediterranea TaxID=105859 RepID=UPI003AF71FB1
MDRKSAMKDFQMAVQMLVGEGEDKDKLYQTMRDYHSNKKLKELITKLKEVLCTPKRLAVFTAIRPFIPAAHQKQYDVLCPSQISKEIRSVKLVGKDGESLGFHIRGGAEFGVGIYISEVLPKSQADRKGLRAGDEVLRVNGFKLSQATHSEVVALMKMRRNIVIKVRYVGMTPIKKGATDPITWKFLTDVGFAATSFLDDVIDSFETVEENSDKRTVNIDLSNGERLGCGVISIDMGIYVQRVSADSPADKAGIKPGDQILEANGVNMRNVSHDEAIKAIKSNTSLQMVVLPKVPTTTEITRTQVEVPKQEKKSVVTPQKPTDVPKDWWKTTPEQLFTDRQIDGRELRKVELKCKQLDFEIEGGISSPLSGAIKVSDVQPGGEAEKSGRLVHKRKTTNLTNRERDYLTCSL